MTAGLLAAVGAAGCSLAKDEAVGSSPDQVVASGDTSALLKSTLVLEGGCTAAKVGPKQLLVSARCVSGNAAFAAGKVLTFTSAASGKGIVADNADDGADEAEPADAGVTDAATKDAGSKDAGAADAGKKPSTTTRDVVIAEVDIHPSYVAKCKDALCGPNKLEASDSPDIAVIVLRDELTTVPSIPVDLDPVGQSDTLLAVTSGCTSLDGKAVTSPRTVKTLAVPAKSVNHVGSAYEKTPQLVTRLASSYVVTAGAGWRSAEERLCKGDLSSPLFRGGSAAVAGVTANYTTYADGKLPVTIHHTRVDAMSRFKIGDWLTSLGALTTHSCSETAGGCVKHDYDGGAPMGPSTEGEGSTQPGDGGAKGDAIAPDAGKAKDGGSADPDMPTGPHGDQLPSDPGDGTSVGEGEGSGDDYADAAAPKKKKTTDTGGCSAAPGTPAPLGGMFLGFGLALGIAFSRRRRAR